MKYDVVYHSTTGNTKKIAEAIAQTAGCDARRADDDPAPIGADIVFVGGAVYATSNHDVHPSIKRFADRLKAASYRGRVAVFATGFAQSDAPGILRRIFQERGISVEQESFFCKGKFMLLMRGHPDAEDIAHAKEFANKFITA